MLRATLVNDDRTRAVQFWPGRITMIERESPERTWGPPVDLRIELGEGTTEAVEALIDLVRS